MVSFRGQTKPEPSSDWATFFPTVILALSISYGGKHPPPPPTSTSRKKKSSSGEVKAVGHSTDSYIAPFNGIRIPEQRKFLLVEYRIREIVALQLWNLEYSSRNPESPQRLQSRIHVPLTKTGIHYVESGIHSVESRIQDCP